MIDFTNCKENPLKTYSGANGNKRAIIYNDEQYMLKFPPKPSKTNLISYTNSCISEYIGSHIFESVGIPAQETILGLYRVNGEDKVVVACKDLAVNGYVLQDFISLKNQVIDSETGGKNTELSEILDAIEGQKALDPVELKERFWDMFIVDSLIGNFDRHNGNWGYLYNEMERNVKLAPVYDCGSCLFPQLSEKQMEDIMSNRHEVNVRVFERPLSAVKENGRKINPYYFINSLKNHDCNEALLRIHNKIDISKINNIIDSTPFVSDAYKKFAKTILGERKEKILDKAHALLKGRESENNKSNYDLTIDELIKKCSDVSNLETFARSELGKEQER